MLSVNSSHPFLLQPAVAIAAAFGLGDGFLCQCQENLLVILSELRFALLVFECQTVIAWDMSLEFELTLHLNILLHVHKKINGRPLVVKPCLGRMPYKIVHNNTVHSNTDSLSNYKYSHSRFSSIRKPEKQSLSWGPGPFKNYCPES